MTEASPEAQPTIIQHPVIKDQVLSLPADQVQQWLDSGWVQLEGDEAEQARAKAVPVTATSTVRP